jgi:hypothetical protein
MIVGAVGAALFASDRARTNARARKLLAMQVITTQKSSTDISRGGKRRVFRRKDKGRES